MAYTKTEWKDQNVENPRTYSVRDNGDSTVTLMDAFGTVTELGTPVNAENMNKIENGIANAVDKDSNQTITGTKVFNGASPIKLGKAGGTSTEIQYTSDGSTRLGGLRNYKSDDNLDCMQMYAASKDGSYILGSIQINRDDNNGIRATAPHPAASTNYNNSAIMTAGRAADPSQNFNLLHRSGDEIFSGVKTGQSNNPRFGFKHTEIDVTTAPAEQKSTRIFFSDKNNKWISEIGVYKNTDDGVVSQITANNDTAGVAELQIICKKDGSKYATCPTPPAADDNSTKISNTQWVNSRITSIMGTVYPVGSLYFGTQSTCPLAAIIDGSTWEKVGTSLTLSVNTSVPVKGNGIALGLTNGANNVGLTTTNNYFVGKTEAYGEAVSPTGTYSGTSGIFGVTTDSAKSGIVGTVTRTALTVNIWKRTA